MSQLQPNVSGTAISSGVNTGQMSVGTSNPVDSPGQSIPGPKVLLMGDSGTGKTTSLISLIEQGQTVFAIATEQNFMQIMKPHLGKGCHYTYIPAQPTQSPSNILDMLKKINMLSYENLTKTVDPFKMQNNRLIDVGQALNSFTCDCCKKNWESPTTWNTDRVLCFDGMSGLSDMAFALVVGNKPVRGMPDYQVAQNALRMILNICVNLKTMFVLVTHLDKEQDVVSGRYYATVRTVGQKLGPDLPRLFSDCVRSVRDGAKITWDTADSQATVVGRHLPMSAGLEPNFKQLVSNWIKQGGKIESTP
jgi:hypothetical protein